MYVYNKLLLFYLVCCGHRQYMRVEMLNKYLIFGNNSTKSLLIQKVRSKKSLGH